MDIVMHKLSDIFWGLVCTNRRISIPSPKRLIFRVCLPTAYMLVWIPLQVYTQ